MHRALGALIMALLLVAAGAAGTAGAATATTNNASVATGSGSSVSIQNQTSGGTTVTVASANVPAGGFVTIHAVSVTEGGEKVFSSVLGTSGYLSEGTHENVTVTLDQPISKTQTVVAMTHKDTNGDHTYSFVSSNGEQDGPYTEDGKIVIDTAKVTASATLSFSAQRSAGNSVVVDRVELAKGGFVTLHDASVTKGKTFESVRGSSAYLSAGVHENVRITLDKPIKKNGTFVPMAHLDTNNNKQYDFLTSDGSEDGPYTDKDGDIVLTTGKVTVGVPSTVTFANQTSGGNYVEVESVFLPNGGFVTAHDSSLLDGKTFESVRGTSRYLEPGLHRNVGIVLDKPLKKGDTIIGMPHKDTNDNQQYDFVESDGSEDGPYTKNGNIVLDSGSVSIAATVHVEGQEAAGDKVTIERVDLPKAGFVTIHSASLTAGQTFESVRGSRYLESGLHEDVTVTLDKPLKTSQTVFAMPHRDTNNNQQYDFVTSSGSQDGPFTHEGNIVLDPARVSVSSQVTFSDQKTDGKTVTIDSVTLHDGGFVTLHGPSLTDGKPLASVKGTSDYLAPGTHTDVTIQIEGDLSTDGTYYAMPHRDTNDNKQYEFVSSKGKKDGPYTAGGAIVLAPAKLTVPGSASVTIDDQTTAGASVTVAKASLSKGGFVTIHDKTLTDGKPFASVRGTSDYLQSGTHSDIKITLDEPLKQSGKVFAMPHKDTNDNKQYDFVSSDGGADGPYTTDGNIVLDPAKISVAKASVTLNDQTATDSVTVAKVSLSQGGFVTIHDKTLTDGKPFASVRGSSGYLKAGSHSDVEVSLDVPVEEAGTFYAMPHLDTNGNQQYDFVSSDGGADGPYTTTGGDIVLDAAKLSPGDSTNGGTSTPEPTNGGGPGFGAVAAILALAGAALLATRR